MLCPAMAVQQLAHTKTPSSDHRPRTVHGVDPSPIGHSTHHQYPSPRKQRFGRLLLKRTQPMPSCAPEALRMGHASRASQRQPPNCAPLRPVPTPRPACGAPL
ncbi:unnamed protein product [Chondrus crispus]|uniref:Uncharacterized protein n=1 Tax=Chondrus crispus TaxID=2769 RepID=R7QEM1_CHOCR|nr:unnamed protein product [Chondrus crispus]CDF36233.1 unnamed protein product [Chondrus crispus]|eukprot:XP_005716052.1 unnamed protein product [Chondrus crispus]